MELDRRLPPREMPKEFVDRCRWCGAHDVERISILRTVCRARLSRGPCVQWKAGMGTWAFLELDEYVDEETFEVKKRPTETS